MHKAGPGTETLGDLLFRVAEGDQSAFAGLYEQISRRVHGLVLRVVRNHAISAEVVQEVFLMLWVSADRYKPELGSPEAWIFTLAHRRAVDRVRSEQRSVARDAQYAQKEYFVQEPVDERVHHTLMSESVKRCLSSLTDLQAEAIRLAYYGGLTYTEVAEALQVKVPTAKSRIQSGLVCLRNAMEADGYGARSR
ncbi:ECF RNA polymerase sigma factor SigK [Arthrobacter parietis]|uniref:ECF RNA polymerase sigma factor SigK n=1 Tax=Arthrobacter parietis TaxID=271434 RepID=A0ABP5MFT3_9MICC